MESNLIATVISHGNFDLYHGDFLQALIGTLVKYTLINISLFHIETLGCLDTVVMQIKYDSLSLRIAAWAVQWGYK